MREEDWGSLKHFSINEAWGDPAAMAFHFLKELDRLRSFIRCKIVIHRGYEYLGSNSNSRHPHGDAADLHAEGISLFDFYLAASRFNFTGIGIYPHWGDKGLHLDSRPQNVRSQWGRIGLDQYVALNTDFFKTHVI